MNILKFARLISYITSVMTNDESLREHQVEDIAEYVSACNEPAKATEAEINNLLAAMKDGKFIEAIKCYRSITGLGLKESKDAIERYRVNVNHPETV